MKNNKKMKIFMIRKGETNAVTFPERCIYCVLILVSAFLFLTSVAEPWLYHDNNGLLTVFFAILFALSFICIIFGIWKLPDTVICSGIWIGIFFVFFIQLYIVFHMQLVPKVDLSHIYDQCVEMLETGNAQITDIHYFGLNTNNIPVTIVIYWVFRFFHAMGLENYRIAGGIFNVFLLLMVYIFSFLILKRLTTMRVTAAVMLLLLVNPAFYAYASYYYTDTVSMAFTMAGAYVILCGFSENIKWKRAFFFFLAGFLIGFAFRIRVTSVFLIVAVAAGLFLRKQWRKLLQYAILLICGILLFLLLWGRVYTYHVNFDTEESAITAEHFLMMGSTGRGTYNADDVKFTRSFDTHEEKVENNLRVYRQRIRENGFLGNLRLIVVKQAIVWGIGARGYSQYTEYVTEETTCYNWITGKNSACFRSYMQSYNIVLFFMIMLGLLAARKKNFDSMSMTVLAVYWAEGLMFYIFWEAHARHSLSFLPFLTMLTMAWFKYSLPERKSVREGRKSIHRHNR